MQTLSPKQKPILNFITAFSKKHEYAPSLEEIKKHFHLRSVATVHQHLASLQSKGYLQKRKNQPRSIVTQTTDRMIQIPLRGVIAAGQLHEAIEQKETIIVPQSKLPFPNGNYYALRVSGDSMIEENIDDGDLVLVKEQNTAQNGEKVVALVDGTEATLKKFYKERNHIRLQPANNALEPIIVRKDTPFAIQGVVVDVIKGGVQEALEEPLKNISRSGASSGALKEWLNRVYKGDVMDLLSALPDESVGMIFGDPDYNVGVRYGGTSYTRSFSEYIDWYIQLTRESMRVLKKDGNLFMLNYPKQNAHLRVKYLDEQFPYVNEYVWVYNTNVGHSPKRFTTAHRSILHIRKTSDNKFFKDAVALPYKNLTDKRIRENLANGSVGRMPYSWFEFNLVKNVSREKTEHACQIPQKLTELLIKASTREGDIIFPLFGGSGAEVEVAWKLKRNFLTAELNPRYCEIIESRLKNGHIADEHRLGPRGRKKIHGMIFPVVAASK